MNKIQNMTTKPGDLLVISSGTAVFKTKEEIWGLRVFKSPEKTISGTVKTNSVHFIPEETTVMVLSEEIITVKLRSKGTEKLKLFSFILDSRVYWAAVRPGRERKNFNKVE